MKGIISIFLIFGTLSCATVKTIDPTDNHINISIGNKNSFCEEIPRIYSGLSYHLCLFYGEPKRVRPPLTEAEKNIPASIRNTDRGGVPFYFIDTVLSLALDTLVLPYTIYKQVDEGFIKVN
ncbi:YceK/YidQ family lipoprotein [Pseudocolwellia sp. HL-MZ19]|uniref:YceK/YidQ family lipoprotein n=1 Tax=unclassified Pseudocolwellia TaxID=2848178 RepID=UPI003CECC242